MVAERHGGMKYEPTVAWALMGLANKAGEPTSRAAWQEKCDTVRLRPCPCHAVIGCSTCTQEKPLDSSSWHPQSGPTVPVVISLFRSFRRQFHASSRAATVWLAIRRLAAAHHEEPAPRGRPPT